MTNLLAHTQSIDELMAHPALQAFTASIAIGSVCVSVHRTDDVFAKASWPKSTVKTIFVTRGERKPSDD